MLAIFLADMNIEMNSAQRIRFCLLDYGLYVAVLLVMAIYLSTSLAIILSSLLCFMWLLAGEFKALPDVVLKNPVTGWALLLFLWFILGLSYTSVSYDVALSMVMKYRELFFIPVFTAFLSATKAQTWVWRAFIIASLVILAISYLMQAGLIAANNQGAFAFKSRITHSIYISFFAFFCAHKAYQGQSHVKLYWLMALISVYNLFFVVDARTGQLTMLILALLFGFQRFSKNALIIGVLALAVLLGLFLNFSDKAARINRGIVSTQAYLQAHPEKSEFSMGERLTFWKYSAKLIAEKPLLGQGTGSYRQEYERIARSEHLVSNNPHNEFLMVTVQLGGVGLLIYCCFLGSQLYVAKRLPDQEKWLAQGLLVSLVVTSLFNSPLMDHGEGHWFAMMIALCFASLQTDFKERTHA
ncbi:MAG: O-antigen ligase family protein [Methylococcales bacterium]|nr:O-antigen ligase family protein [Methylococcales bacterium]